MYCVKLGAVKRYSVFSNKIFNENEIIGEYISSSHSDIGRRLYNGMYETDILGRYCNHSDVPNTRLLKVNDDSVILIANCEIQIGCEIVVNYKEVEIMVGVPYLTYYKEHFTNDILFNFGKKSGNKKII